MKAKATATTTSLLAESTSITDEMQSRIKLSGNNSIEIPDLQAKNVLSVSICGSYHRHLREMRKLISGCKQVRIQVLIPKYAVKKFSTQGFVYLRGENGTPKSLQEKNFGAISKSSFILVVNPKGYIGSSTSMEIGYAIAKGIPIFCTDKPSDYIFQLYTEYGKSLPEIKEMLLHH
jgi:hypothetical protein